MFNLLEFAVFEKRVTDGPTDRPTDGRTKPLMELLFATKNLRKCLILKKDRGSAQKDSLIIIEAIMIASLKSGASSEFGFDPVSVNLPTSPGGRRRHCRRK